MKKEKIRRIAKRITAFAAAVAMAATFTFPAEVGGGFFDGFGNAIVASAYTDILDIRSGDITISSDGTYLISGDGSEVANIIIVKKDVSADITLQNVNIVANGQPAFMIEDDSKGNVTISLDGTNVLKATTLNHAGLQKNGDTNSGTLKITGSGSLEAYGGPSGAGIGGGSMCSGSNIIIENCKVTAKGGSWGSGIGGGNKGKGSKIDIINSNVTATGDFSGAGIGGGSRSEGSNITITNSTVTATGGSGGAGIGGGCHSNGNGGNGSNITITNSTVTAKGDFGGAGIGGGKGGNGYGGNGSDITITSSTVTATGASGGAGIGGGYSSKSGVNGGNGSNITITNSTVTATSDSSKGFGIGNGRDCTTSSSNLKINGGSVNASPTSGVVFTNNDNKTVYCLTIDSNGETPVKIDGTAYTPTRHSDTDTKIYVYLPDLGENNPHTVQVGTAGPKYYIYNTSKKMWVEKTISDKIVISGLDAPQPGNSFDDSATINLKYKITSIKWQDSNSTNVTSSKAGYNKQYTALVTVKPANDTDIFDRSGITASVNDKTAQTDNLQDRELTVIYTFPATRAAKVTGIVLKDSPTKTDYYIGDSLDISGCTITATYEDGSKKDITVESSWVSGFDTNTAGNGKTATITYSNDTTSGDKTTAFTYNVKPVGTISNGYYQLSTEADLKWFSEYVNDGHKTAKGILLNDITVTASGWTPIGTSTAPFAGTFDGAGYTISGLTVNDNSADNVGLFGYIKNGTVKKVCVSGASFKGDANVGGICGRNDGGTISECLVYDSTISGTSNVGGIAGKSSGKIENCCNAGSVIGSGIVGNGSSVIVSNCLNVGKVTVDNISGGGSATITDCYYNKELSDVTSGNGKGTTTIDLTNGSITISDAWEKTANDYDAKKLYYPNLKNIKAAAFYVTYEPSLKITNTNSETIKFGDDMTFTFDAVLTMEGKEVVVTSQLDPTTLSELQFSAEHNSNTVTFKSQLSLSPSVKIMLMINDREAGYITYDMSAKKVLIVITEDFDAGTHKVSIDYNGTGAPMFTGVSGFCSVTIDKADAPVVTEPSASDVVYGELLSASVLDDDDWSWVDDSVVPKVSNSGFAAYLPVDDKNYDYSSVTGYDPTKHTVVRDISVTVKPAVPTVVVTAKPEAEIPGKVIKVSAVVSNPNNANLSDLPAAKLTYRIGSGAEQDISGGSFVIPEDTAIGALITVTAATSATADYEVGTDSASVIVTACEHTNKTLEYNENAHWYHCSNCGADIDREAHNGGTATCTEKAVCKVCKQQYGSIDSNNHTGLSTEWFSDITGHWHECADCHGRTDKAEHISDGPATVDKSEKCTICGYEIAPALGRVGTPRILPNGGRFSEAVTVKIECSSDSASVYYTTDGSDPAVNGIFYTGAFTLESNAKVRAIAKKSGMANSFEASADFVFSTEHIHTVMPEWKYDETRHWHICSDCSEKLDLSEHTFGDWEITVPATAEANGKKECTCSICGYVQEDIVIYDGDETSGEVDNATDPDTNALHADLELTDEDILNKIPLTDEELELIENGADLTVYMIVIDYSANVPAEEKALAESVLSDGMKIGMYIDVSLFKKVGNNEPKPVTQTYGDLKITFEMPEKLINTDKNVTRQYSIIRVHDGNVTVLDCAYDSATRKGLFSTDRFSTYAIAYNDIALEEPAPEPTPIVRYPISVSGNVYADKTTAAAGEMVNVRTDLGYDIIVTAENGQRIAKITEKGSFSMPASKVYVTAVQNETFALMANAWRQSYVYSYDADMNKIKVSSTKKRGVIVIDLGEEYADKAFTIYNGRKSTKVKVTDGVLDAKGRFTFEVPDGKNYTLIVEG